MRVRIAQASDDLALQKLKATTSPRYPDHAPEPGQVVLVATESVRSVFGYLVGTVQGAYSGSGRPTPPPHGYLQTIAVATGVRRQGIGSRLVETFVEQCRAAARAWIFLFPDEDTGVQARVRFFSSCGFRSVPVPDEPWPRWGAGLEGPTGGSAAHETRRSRWRGAQLGSIRSFRPTVAAEGPTSRSPVGGSGRLTAVAERRLSQNSPTGGL